MAFPYSAHKTYVDGETLTAADLNATDVNHINNQIPENTDDYSANVTEMRANTDPYPAASESLATSLSEELERIRYVIKQITGKSQWYIDAASIGSKGADVASASALTLGTDGNFFDITGTTTITSIGTLGVGSVVRLQFDGALTLTHNSTDLVLPDGRDITTKAGDIATFVEYATGDWFLAAYNRNPAETLVNYRRPRLEYISATQVDVENNTGTSNETKIVFPDGNTRSVTEDTSSTNVNRRFDITATAEFTSGTEDSGLRASLSESNDTWYAIYAVKSAINTANFVLVGDTTLPLQSNFSTLNSNFGTNGWVYLGMIRNGDQDAAAGDIIEFMQSGNKTVFSNVASGNAGVSTPGMLLATSGAATTVTYSHSAGTGAAQIPNHLAIVNWGAGVQAPGALFAVEDAAVGTRTYYRNADTNGLAGTITGEVQATKGVRCRTTSSTDIDLYLVGFVDDVLGVGSNAIL